MNREAIIHGEGILGLIPQRPPIVMVDSFFGIEGELFLFRADHHVR